MRSRPAGPLRLGVSACLLGEEVRWNGGHERFAWLVETLGPRVEWVRVCPEVEIGLGVPREPIQLVREGNAIRLRGVQSGTDLTERMRAWAHRRLAALGELDGFVLKSRSPSCGRSVEVSGGEPAPGRFAAALASLRPEVPLVEDSDLEDAAARERFLERAIACRASRALRTPPRERARRPPPAR